MRIRRIRAALIHAEGQRGMTKLTIAFRNFSKILKIKIDSSILSVCKEKYDGWPWPLLEAALSIFNVRVPSNSSFFARN